MISYQDDHARFITGSVKIWSPTGENAMLLLDRAVKKYGAPTQILTDQGTQFTPARGEISAFDVHCSELGIEPICASVCRPTTCGKIEASIKPTKLSHTSLESIGALYATITTQDRMRE
jgi:transposase InsO family protein